MAVPRARTSNARKNSRRSHHARKPKNVQACPNCKGTYLPHKLCLHCGFYRGKAVVGEKES